MAKLPRFDETLFKRAERWVFGLVGLTILLTLAGVVATSSKSLGQHMAAFPWGAVGWLVVATVAESALRFWRYHTASVALRIPVPFWRLAYYYTVGYALLPTPGKVGTVIRLWLMKVYHQLPYRRTAPLMVMDFVSDAVAMCALGALTLMILDHPLLQTLGWVLLAALGVGVAALIVAPWALEAMIGWLYRAGGKQKPRRFARLRQIVRSSARLGGPLLLITTAQSFVGWALVGVAVGYLVSAMGVPLNAVEGTAVIAMGTMGGFLSMMPAGVGGAEASMGFLLAQFGVPLATVLLAVAIIRLVVLWLTVALGLVLLPFALRGANRRVVEG